MYKRLAQYYGALSDIRDACQMAGDDPDSLEDLFGMLEEINFAVDDAKCRERVEGAWNCYLQDCTKIERDRAPAKLPF